MRRKGNIRVHLSFITKKHTIVQYAHMKAFTREKKRKRCYGFYDGTNQEIISGS